jgi:hypothetical protein
MQRELVLRSFHAAFVMVNYSVIYLMGLIAISIMTSILVTAGLLKFSCISIQEHIQSHREQFWGRAALAPVILSGSGRFYILAKARIGFRRLECSTNLLRLAGQF